VGSSSRGALVLSLDFELWWGVRERAATEQEQRTYLLSARSVVPRLLALFEEFDVAATWATVGFLFAESREELERFAPSLRPSYLDARLSPYGDAIGADEADDPLRFAPSLIEAIGRTPRQEIGTHTFSHYYCGEPGQTRESFRADLQAACAIAAQRGVQLRSIVFPRNQHNADYDDVLIEHGIHSFRGNPRAASWSFRDADESRKVGKRLVRLLNGYVGSADAGATSWTDVRQPNGLSDVRASSMLRPYLPSLRHLEGLRLERICRSLRSAARHGRFLHLWWHPHNFARHPEENLAFLRGVLEEFASCRNRWGMRSMSMEDVHSFAGGTEEQHGGEVTRKLAVAGKRPVRR
jgi:peptidoglycan/xylan/chitin deacetylase (PgdA/CDA1 family)